MTFFTEFDEMNEKQFAHIKPKVNIKGDEHTTNNGTHYQIQGRMLDKYKGCGNGCVVVNDSTGMIIDMWYGTIDKKLDDQNIDMTDQAGKVVAKGKGKTTYIANFSCCDACLF